MSKTEFLKALRHALGKLPSNEVEQSLAFYAEMIDDRIEDGMSEPAAVAALGPVNAIAAQIIAETPAIPKAIAKANTGSRTLNIVLLAILCPLWIPIVLALALAVLAVYLGIWAVIVGLWVTVAVLILCGPFGLAALAYCLFLGYPLAGTYTLGVGLICSGLGLFASFGILGVSKRLVVLTHRFARWVRGLFKKQKDSSGPTATLQLTPEPPTQANSPTANPANEKGAHLHV